MKNINSRPSQNTGLIIIGMLSDQLYQIEGSSLNNGVRNPNAKICYWNIMHKLNELRRWFSKVPCSTLRWRHNDGDSVSNHQPHDCLLSCLFGRTSKKTSKLRVTGLCVGNSPGTGEFPAQMASNAENVSIWWRHHELLRSLKWNHLDRYFWLSRTQYRLK